MPVGENLRCTGKVPFDFELYLRQSFVSRSSVICQSFVSRSSVICQSFVSNSSVLRQTFVSHLSIIRRSFVSHFLVICQSFVSHLSDEETTGSDALRFPLLSSGKFTGKTCELRRSSTWNLCVISISLYKMLKNGHFVLSLWIEMISSKK